MKNNMRMLPFSISSYGYFPADMLSFTILNTYNDVNSLVYGFYDLFGNICYHSDGKMSYNAEINWECPTLCRKYVPRNILEYLNKSLYLDFINSCIDNDYYVYLTLDVSKISCYKIRNNFFKPHPLTIYGYNNEKKIFYFADFINGQYIKCEMGYKEFLDSNISIVEKMQVLDKYSGTNEWILDLELVKYLKTYKPNIKADFIIYLFSLFISGRSLLGNKLSIRNNIQPQVQKKNKETEYYEAPISDEDYGINVFYGILEHMKKCKTSNKYMFNYKHTYLVNMYYEILQKKAFIISENFGMGSTIDVLFKDIDQHKEMLNLAINLSLKYNISSSAIYLDKIIDILNKEIYHILSLSKQITTALKNYENIN